MVDRHGGQGLAARLFGGADYAVTVDLGNGFDIEENWPHSEIFDRRVNALRFTVTREWAAMNFGPVNHVFPVRLEAHERARS